MGFNVVPMCLYGVSYGSQQCLYVSLWVSLSPTVIHGVPICPIVPMVPSVSVWVTMCPYLSQCPPYGLLCASLGTLWGLLWVSLGPYVFLLVFMGFNVLPMCLYGVSYGSQRGPYVSLWVSLSPTVIHGVPMGPSVSLWVTMCPYLSQCPPYGLLCASLGTLWGLLWVSAGSLCVSMGLNVHVIHGVPMFPSVPLCAPVSPYGSLCVPMGPSVPPVGCYVPL